MKLTINNWGQFNIYTVYELLVIGSSTNFISTVFVNKITTFKI